MTPQIPDVKKIVMDSPIEKVGIVDLWGKMMSTEALRRISFSLLILCGLLLNKPNCDRFNM